MNFEYGFATNTGRVRDHNEDGYLLMPEHGLYVVADGMGGHAHGEVASQLALDSIKDCFSLKDSNCPPAALGLDRLVGAIRRANTRIYEMAQGAEAMRSMGTTLVAVLAHNEEIHLAHVGDSRIYRHRLGRLEQLTEDHSLLTEYLKKGIITQDQARAFPMKNIIMRAMGLASEVLVDTNSITPQVDDIFLLCTDGLNDMVADEDINSILLQNKSVSHLCEDLIEAALQGGGGDNVTVVLLKVASV